MLKVEVIEKDGEERLAVNGIIDEFSRPSTRGNGDMIDDVELNSKLVISQLCDYSFQEVSTYINQFSYTFKTIDKLYDIEVYVF